MFIQQRLNPQPTDPVQAKVFMFLPVFFTFLLANFAAGLVIYWTFNNILSIIQQRLIMWRMGVGNRSAPMSAARNGPAADPAAPTRAPAALEYGRWLFEQECRFLLGAVDLAHLPAPAAPEVAFAGRSNVGKSSLVNALTGRKTLARTSNTPGRTRELNFFDLGGRW